jgi:hypothetical protein
LSILFELYETPVLCHNHNNDSHLGESIYSIKKLPIIFIVVLLTQLRQIKISIAVEKESDHFLRRFKLHENIDRLRRKVRYENGQPVIIMLIMKNQGFKNPGLMQDLFVYTDKSIMY